MPSGGPLLADSAPAPRKPCQLGHGICGSGAGFPLRKRNHSNQQGILLQLSVKLRDIANAHRVVSGGVGGQGGKRELSHASERQGAGSLSLVCHRLPR